LSGGKKAICYCASVNYSKQMAEQFINAGIQAAHIDGETPKYERSKIIESFRSGEITILCNVDLISEGFDVPDCNTAILLRPTKSLTLYIQQSMRCMRYADGKQAVIIDHVGNYARFGLPDMERKWSLEVKKTKKMNEIDVKIRQCPECFFTHEFDDECPACGFVYGIRRERIIDEVHGELEQIQGFSLNYKTPEDCNSMRELYEYAKSRNFKRGWAYYTGKAMGFI